MRDVAELLLSWVLSLFACFVVVIRDENRLPPERLGRAWPPVSRDAAIVAFGQLAVFVHFVRTRGWRGVPVGLLWTLAVTLPSLVAELAFDALS